LAGDPRRPGNVKAYVRPTLIRGQELIDPYTVLTMLISMATIWTKNKSLAMAGLICGACSVSRLNDSSDTMQSLSALFLMAFTVFSCYFEILRV
ncbi:hypothetical protein H632_c1162p0, partial [Helicosporidium sp. ATCC 50920]